MGLEDEVARVQAAAAAKRADDEQAAKLKLAETRVFAQQCNAAFREAAEFLSARIRPIRVGITVHGRLLAVSRSKSPHGFALGYRSPVARLKSAGDLDLLLPDGTLWSYDPRHMKESRPDPLRAGSSLYIFGQSIHSRDGGVPMVQAFDGDTAVYSPLGPVMASLCAKALETHETV